jgi:hypothetical protein
MNCRLAGNDISIISLNKNPDGEKVFAITNADNNTELVCRKGSTGEVVSRKNLYDETHTIGTYIIRITNCNCARETQSKVYRIPHPCRIVTEQKNIIRIAIPSRWTNLAKSQIIKAITVEKDLVMATLFSNVSEVYNQYWMDKDLVYNATLKRRFGEYASLIGNVHKNNWVFNAYTSVIWDSALTIALIALWCKIMLLRLGPRITAYPTVFTPAVRALDDKEIAHKVNIFLGTVGSMTVLVVIIFPVLIFFCFRKWKKEQLKVKCVRGEEEPPYLPTQAAPAYSEALRRSAEGKRLYPMTPIEGPH